MYKMIGSQMLGKGQTKLPDNTCEQGSFNPGNTAKPTGHNPTGVFPAGGVTVQGGTGPFNVNKAKKGGSNVDLTYWHKKAGKAETDLSRKY